MNEYLLEEIQENEMEFLLFNQNPEQSDQMNQLEEKEQVGCTNCMCKCIRNNVKRGADDEERTDGRKKRAKKERTNPKDFLYACMYCTEKFADHNQRNNHCLSEHKDEGYIIAAVLPGKEFGLGDKRVIIKDCFKVVPLALREMVQNKLKKMKKVHTLKGKDYVKLPFKVPKNASGVELILFNQSNVEILRELMSKITPKRPIKYMWFDLDTKSGIYVPKNED